MGISLARAIGKNLTVTDPAHRDANVFGLGSVIWYRPYRHHRHYFRLGRRRALLAFCLFCSMEFLSCGR